MPRLSLKTRRRVIALQEAGYFTDVIKQQLKEENITTTSWSLLRLKKKYSEYGTYLDLP